MPVGKGGRRKKTRTHKVVVDGDEEKKIPKSFILRRGKTSAVIRDLVRDLRDVMSPNTAKKLKERKKNSVKDFIHVAGPLGVTHMTTVHSTDTASYMKMARLPSGPTVTFKLVEYCLSRDVQNSQKRPIAKSQLLHDAPLLVLNGIREDDKVEQMKVTASTLKHMFAPIDVRTFKVSTCRRVALFNYDKATDEFEFRHYGIRKQQQGLSRGVRKLLTKRKLDLSRSDDIADYVQSGGYASDSELEDNVDLPLRDKANRNVACNLVELGPRIRMKLVKVEDGVCGGKTLWKRQHVFDEKEAELQAERQALRDDLEKRKEKAERERKQQKRELRQKRAAKMAVDGAGSSDEDPEKGEGDGAKRKSYHPFAHWKGKEGEQTVEFEDDDKKKNKSKKARLDAKAGKTRGKKEKDKKGAKKAKKAKKGAAKKKGPAKKGKTKKAGRGMRKK